MGKGRAAGSAAKAAAGRAGAAKSPIAAVISLAEAATLLGRSKQWINTLERDGWIKKAERGRYRLVDVVQGYGRFLTEERKSASKNASQTRLQDARAREIEQRIAREEHQLIDTNEAIACVDEIVGILKAELDGMPAGVTRDLELRREIETRLNDIFQRASERLEQKSSALRSSGEADTSGPEVDA